MLDVKQCVTFTGSSKIAEKVAARYSASINYENPEDLQLSEAIADRDLYRDNRDECHKDQAEFEDMVYAMQAEMAQVDAKKEG